MGYIEIGVPTQMYLEYISAQQIGSVHKHLFAPVITRSRFDFLAIKLVKNNLLLVLLRLIDYYKYSNDLPKYLDQVESQQFKIHSLRCVRCTLHGLICFHILYFIFKKLVLRHARHIIFPVKSTYMQELIKLKPKTVIRLPRPKSWDRRLFKRMLQTLRLDCVS